MTGKRVLIAAFIILVMAPQAAAAGIYKWVDDQGNVHFGDKPPTESTASEVRVRINSYSSPEITSSPNVSQPDKVAGSKRVVLYSTTWCGYCKQARNYFRSKNIPFTEYDVENSRKGRRDYEAMGGSSVPIILVGNKRLNGFSPAYFEQVYY